MPFVFKPGGLLWSLPYLFAAYLSTALSANVGAGGEAAIWLPAGVAMAAMMLTRPAGWPAVLTGIVATQTVFGVLHGAGLLQSLLIAIGLAAAPAIALAVVVRFAHVPLHGLYFLRALFLAALIDSALASIVDTTFSHGTVFTLLNATLRGVAHFVGIFAVTPLFTTWSRFRPSRQVMHGVAENVISGLALVALILCAMFAFNGVEGSALNDDLAIGLSYVPLVLCVLIALLWDARGGALSVLVLALIALWQTALGHGPFGHTQGVASLIGVQTYLGVAAVLVLLSTTLRGHRESALERAHRWRTNIELALTGNGQLFYCLDTKRGRAEWSGDVEGITGRTADSLATLEGMLAVIGPDDRVRARSRWLRAAGRQRVGEMTFALLTRDGTPVHITDSCSAVGDLDEDAPFITGIWRRAASSSEAHRPAEPFKDGEVRA
jgi:PAS domain-containing protein